MLEVLLVVADAGGATDLEFIASVDQVQLVLKQEAESKLFLTSHNL